MKAEALKLADDIANGIENIDRAYLSAMIRRLVEELDKPHPKCDKSCMYLCQTKPLSDNEIHDIWKSLWEGGNIGHIAYNYARAIEERHGIK